MPQIHLAQRQRVSVLSSGNWLIRFVHLIAFLHRKQWLQGMHALFPFQFKIAAQTPNEQAVEILFKLVNISFYSFIFS